MQAPHPRRPASGPRYVYVGPKPGFGEEHIVVFTEPDCITTAAEKHAWTGPADLFAKHFKPV